MPEVKVICPRCGAKFCGYNGQDAESILAAHMILKHTTRGLLRGPSSWTRCTQCMGYGFINGSQCPKCGGAGIT